MSSGTKQRPGVAWEDLSPRWWGLGQHRACNVVPGTTQDAQPHEGGSQALRPRAPGVRKPPFTAGSLARSVLTGQAGTARASGFSPCPLPAPYVAGQQSPLKDSHADGAQASQPDSVLCHLPVKGAACGSVQGTGMRWPRSGAHPSEGRPPTSPPVPEGPAPQGASGSRAPAAPRLRDVQAVSPLTSPVCPQKGPEGRGVHANPRAREGETLRPSWQKEHLANGLKSSKQTY